MFFYSSQILYVFVPVVRLNICCGARPLSIAALTF